MKSGVYKITNKINEKVYIGESENISKRWIEHRCPSKIERVSHLPIGRAFLKYGFENFVFEIIEELPPDKDILLIREKYWKDFYKSYDSKFGYNSIVGVESSSNRAKEKTSKKVVLINPKTGEKKYEFDSIKEAMDSIGRQHAVSKYLNKKDKIASGYIWIEKKNYNPDEDYIHEIYKPKIKQKAPDPKNWKKVAKYSLDTGEIIEVYPSAAEAARQNNIANRDHIGRVCRGERNMLHGFGWKYTD